MSIGSQKGYIWRQGNHTRYDYIRPDLSHFMRKPVFAICDNKGADQPAHPRSLISAFVVRCVDSIMPFLAKS